MPRFEPQLSLQEAEAVWLGLTVTAAGPTVHTFGSTGEAYNRTQTDDKIKNGDTLHVPSEGVVGYLHDAWPTAVTKAHGEFHQLVGSQKHNGPKGEGHQVCQSCHGAAGIPSPAMAKAMGVKPVTDPAVKSSTAAKMIASTKNGMGKMPAFKDKLTDAQITDSVTYFRSFTK